MVYNASLSPLSTKERKENISFMSLLHFLRLGILVMCLSHACCLHFFPLYLLIFYGLLEHVVGFIFNCLVFYLYCSIFFLYLSTTCLLRTIHLKISLLVALYGNLNKSLCCFIWYGMNISLAYLMSLSMIKIVTIILYNVWTVLIHLIFQFF
jgi:hypothetical protein